ncbi:DUF6783 domain-containing protein [uncultured Robinsoniella sp.]|uniref:DUF6783 domain-containing protein n=1 Tax=uncultured Robinsoniella sp. TaxID=904190 RepID=UPI00374F02DC
MFENNSCHLHAPLCGIFVPNSGYVARYVPFNWHKSPTIVSHSSQKAISSTL